MSVSDDRCYTLPEAHRHFAVTANGEVWRLLEQSTRTSEEDAALLRAAHTCLYHWLHAGSAVHHQRGEWLLARVYAVLGNSQAALRHAARCMHLTDQYRAEMEDFDLAYAYEGLARAHALAGNPAEARRYHAQAAAAGQTIGDAEDRSIFLGDFEGGEWYGLTRS